MYFICEQYLTASVRFIHFLLCFRCWGELQTMIFEKMKRNCFLQLFSIVLAVHTIQDGLMVNAASASHKGMSNKQISGTFSLSLSLSSSQYVRVYRLDCAISEIQQQTRNNNEKHEETKTKTKYESTTDKIEYNRIHVSRTIGFTNHLISIRYSIERLFVKAGKTDMCCSICMGTWGLVSKIFPI